MQVNQEEVKADEFRTVLIHDTEEKNSSEDHPYLKGDTNHNNIPDDQEVMTTCCGVSDRRFHLMIVQTVLAFAISSLCLVKLSDSTLDCDHTQLYSSLLFSIIGFFFSKK